MPLCSLGKKLLSGHPEGSFLENGAQLSPRVSVRFWVGFSPSGTKLDASTPSRGACRMQRAWGSSARGFLLLHGGSGGLGGAQREHSVTGTVAASGSRGRPSDAAMVLPSGIGTRCSPL